MADVLRFRDDEPADEPAVTLDAFLDQPDAVSVRITVAVQSSWVPTPCSG